MVIIHRIVNTPRMVMVTNSTYQVQAPQSLFGSDLEKVVNHPQAENSDVDIVLKIAGFATKDKEKNVYQILVWHDGILKS